MSSSSVSLPAGGTCSSCASSGEAAPTHPRQPRRVVPDRPAPDFHSLHARVACNEHAKHSLHRAVRQRLLSDVACKLRMRT